MDWTGAGKVTNQEGATTTGIALVPVCNTDKEDEKTENKTVAGSNAVLLRRWPIKERI